MLKSAWLPLLKMGHRCQLPGLCVFVLSSLQFNIINGIRKHSIFFVMSKHLALQSLLKGRTSQWYSAEVTWSKSQVALVMWTPQTVFLSSVSAAKLGILCLFLLLFLLCKLRYMTLLLGSAARLNHFWDLVASFRDQLHMTETFRLWGIDRCYMQVTLEVLNISCIALA